MGIRLAILIGACIGIGIFLIPKIQHEKENTGFSLHGYRKSEEKTPRTKVAFSFYQALEKIPVVLIPEYKKSSQQKTTVLAEEEEGKKKPELHTPQELTNDKLLESIAKVLGNETPDSVLRQLKEIKKN